MKKTIKLLFIIIFFITCTIPILCIPFVSSVNTENRSLSSLPTWTLENGSFNLDYFNELETYVSEHFAFRSQLIEWDNLMKYKLFHSSGNEQVILGKNEWMFFSETLEDYSGITLPVSEMEQITNNLAKICNYIQEQGKQPAIMIIPNKNTIYPEYMPDSFGSLDTPTNLDILQEQMQQKNIPYIDAKKILWNNKSLDTLYLQYDTHWNNTGARIVLNELYRFLDINSQHTIDNYTIENSHVPDLYPMLFPTQDYMEEQHIYPSESSYEHIGRFRGLDDLNIETASDNGNGKRILLYRDSFGRAMIPYMAEQFDYCIFNRSTPYDLSLIAETECDYVVIEIVERNISDLGDIIIP